MQWTADPLACVWLPLFMAKIIHCLFSATTAIFPAKVFRSKALVMRQSRWAFARWQSKCRFCPIKLTATMWQRVCSMRLCRVCCIGIKTILWWRQKWPLSIFGLLTLPKAFLSCRVRFLNSRGCPTAAKAWLCYWSRRRNFIKTLLAILRSVKWVYCRFWAIYVRFGAWFSIFWWVCCLVRGFNWFSRFWPKRLLMWASKTVSWALFISFCGDNWCFLLPVCRWSLFKIGFCCTSGHG